MRYFCALILLVTATLARCQESDLADALRDFDARVIVQGKLRENPLAFMLARDARAELRTANLRDARAWAAVTTRADWEAFRDSRLQALRESLGNYPPPKEPKVHITRAHRGDGYFVDNVVLESRPGLFVAANVYRPLKPKDSMPGMLIVHSHQRPKNTGARQDMAMTWARAGCVVLVPDLLGHGERRVHPFINADAFDKPFREEMQDYWFRYDLGMQLHLIGDSLMGWMVYDLARCVDVLLAQPGVDAKRIVVISEPAGGGDVAAVAMALDSRITGGVITNFGGPQPETPYPLPKDAEQTFDYAGSGSWESTRNLRLSARDGFLPWTIVASVAPRKLIYNHEFYWDRDNDPVWKRLQKVYSFYKAADSLEGIAGSGFVVGSPPENTHWIPLNREILYPTLERWFDIPNPKTEYSKRRPESELICLTPDAMRELRPRPVHDLMAQIGEERVQAARKKLEEMKLADRRAALREHWERLLGNNKPGNPQPIGPPTTIVLERMRIERHHLSVEPGIVVPLIVILPPQTQRGKVPVVVGIAQDGKQAFLKNRAEVVAALLRDGMAVALPDLRGTGETSPGEGRDRRGPTTALSATGLMTGQTLLGARLRDLRSVLVYLKKHPHLDGKRIALWGDSFVEPAAIDVDLRMPHGVDGRPPGAEPLGGLLALLGSLYDDDVRAGFIHRGLSSFSSALQGPFCYLPHDCMVPGVLTAGDISDLAAVLAPRPMRLSSLVDGRNRKVARPAGEKVYASTRAAYASTPNDESFILEVTPPNANQLARWLAGALRAD